MADTKIQFSAVADAATCQFTGITFSVSTARPEPLPARIFITNVGVSQDPTAPLRRRGAETRNATASPPRSRRRRLAKHSARETAGDADGDGVPDGGITRTIATKLLAGQNTLGWGSDVPEGYYVVTATIDDPAVNYEVVVSPRFFVRQEGRGTDCLSSVSVDASAALPQPSSSTMTLSTTSAPTGATTSTHLGHTHSQFPVAAIVGIAIAALVLAIILILVCVWNRRHRLAPPPSKKKKASIPPVVKETHSSFFARDRGTYVQTQATTPHYIPTSAPPPPVPPLPQSHRGRR